MTAHLLFLHHLTGLVSLLTGMVSMIQMQIRVLHVKLQLMVLLTLVVYLHLLIHLSTMQRLTVLKQKLLTVLKILTLLLRVFTLHIHSLTVNGTSDVTIGVCPSLKQTAVCGDCLNRKSGFQMVRMVLKLTALRSSRTRSSMMVQCLTANVSLTESSSLTSVRSI